MGKKVILLRRPGRPVLAAMLLIPALLLGLGRLAGEEIMEPVLSEVLEPEEEAAGDECGDPEETSATDALRAALTAIRPALARMPKKQRRKVAADIAARLRKQSGRKAADGKTYAALAAASRRKPAAVGADLGKRIMERRNPNYRK